MWDRVEAPYQKKRKDAYILEVPDENVEGTAAIQYTVFFPEYEDVPSFKPADKPRKWASKTVVEKITMSKQWNPRESDTEFKFEDMGVPGLDALFAGFLAPFETIKSASAALEAKFEVLSQHRDLKL